MGRTSLFKASTRLGCLQVSAVKTTITYMKKMLCTTYLLFLHRCHMTDAVTARLKRQAKTDVSLIPGGLTKQLQPADVSWNKPFKAAYRELYSNWMANGEKSYTPTGNMRAPDKLLCLQWVKEAWKSVTTDIIVKSFRPCGISANIDGSEDSFSWRGGERRGFICRY